MGERMEGAEITLLSSTMAKTAADVLRGQAAKDERGPRVEAEVHHRLAVLAEARLGRDEILPLDVDAAEHADGAAALGVFERLRFRVRDSRIVGDHAELELGLDVHAALDLLGVLLAGHLDEDAVGTLALQVRLLDAVRIDPLADDLERLAHDPRDLVADLLVGQSQAEEAGLGLLDVHRTRACLSEHGAGDGLGQLAHAGERVLAVAALPSLNCTERFWTAIAPCTGKPLSRSARRTSCCSVIARLRTTPAVSASISRCTPPADRAPAGSPCAAR